MTIDPYCTVKCEKTQSVGLALKDNPNPVWDQSFVFYPKNPATAKVSGKRRLPLPRSLTTMLQPCWLTLLGLGR